MSIRPTKQIAQTTPTLEGAGVKLERAFGFGKTGDFDPFLLFDDFRNENQDNYRAGFPWHPHRGIETITYVLTGTVEHGDSLGNRGSLGAGDVQRCRQLHLRARASERVLHRDEDRQLREREPALRRRLHHPLWRQRHPYRTLTVPLDGCTLAPSFPVIFGGFP
jgi:hypothetical protein